MNITSGQFRKKPVVISAWLIDLDGDKPDWVAAAFAAETIDWCPSGEGLYINTLEGHMKGDMGDWLIRGVKGELYACKPDIFSATYDDADDAPADALSQIGTALDYITNGSPLHTSTAHLVLRFARALAEKLARAEVKYGYTDGWTQPDWMDECRAQLVEHIAKGDPRDVAAYCAFLWHHGQSTAGPRT